MAALRPFALSVEPAETSRDDSVAAFVRTELSRLGIDLADRSEWSIEAEAINRLEDAELDATGEGLARLVEAGRLTPEESYTLLLRHHRSGSGV